MRRLGSFVWGILCVWAAVGCDQEGQELASSSISPEVFPEKYAEVACEAVSRCCSPTDTAKEPCLQEVTQSMAEEMESIKSGRTTFDANSAATCLAALSAGFKDCALSEEEKKGAEICDKMLMGTGKEGELCEAAYHCASGLDCFLSSSDGKGRCTVFAQLGESCRNKQCAPGKSLTCASVVNSTDRICSKAASLGESCKSINCGDGLYCNRKVSPATCAAELAAGATCESHEQCASRACSKGICVAEGSICAMFGVESAPARIRARSTGVLNLGPRRKVSK